MSKIKTIGKVNALWGKCSIYQVSLHFHTRTILSYKISKFSIDKYTSIHTYITCKRYNSVDK